MTSPLARLLQQTRALPPIAVELLVVTVVGVCAASDLAVGHPGSRPSDRLSWLLLAVSLLALVWRRRWPVPVAVVTGAACAGWALHGHLGELLNLPAMVALYSVAVSGSRRRTLITAVVAAVVSGAVALNVCGQEANPQGAPVLEMVWPLVPLLLGVVIRTRRQLLAEYAARAERAEADREREAARRVHEERVRIARELHDIVSHTVTAMTVQAGVALDAFDARPELARQAMRQVRESGREAVGELRSTVTVLRAVEDEETGPVPGLGQLAELVERFAGSGLGVTLQGAEAVAGVPPLAGLAAYRIVQESLTNVVKHAGSARAAVSMRRTGGGLAVEVVDDGRGPAREPGEGFGLVGMRERAAAVGGSIEYGPGPDGGFRVRAWLPVDEARLPVDEARRTARRSAHQGAP